MQFACTGARIQPSHLPQTYDGGRYFKGVIDEVRLYNRALSEREILAQAQLPARPGDQAARISLTPRFKMGLLGFDALFTKLVVKDGRVECALTSKGESQPRRLFSAPLRPTRPDSERAIAQQTRHRSLASLRRYIRRGTLFEENAASVLGL